MGSVTQAYLNKRLANGNSPQSAPGYNDFSSLQSDASANNESSMALDAARQAALTKQQNFAGMDGTNADLAPSAYSVQPQQAAAGLSAVGTAIGGASGGGGSPLGSAASAAGAGFGVAGLAGAGIGAGVGLLSGLAQQRMAMRDRANQAQAGALNKVADIQQNAGFQQQSALANIMAAIRGSFGGN
jgi:hypothetical protein